MSKAFTLLELIMAIVIIGVLSAVAIPKFTGLSDNAKISAELSTAASVQVALDACHGEWIINEGSFICGKDIDPTEESDFDKINGYPKTLGNPLDRILKSPTPDWTLIDGKYYGPASNPTKGATYKPKKADKPYMGCHWEYNSTSGTFELKRPS